MLKIQQYKHKTRGFRTFSCFGPTFGIHSHKALNTVQLCHLLKPNWKPFSSHSISIPANTNCLLYLQQFISSSGTGVGPSRLRPVWRCSFAWRTSHLPRAESRFAGGRLVSGRTSVRCRFGSPFSSKVVVCGHGLVTLSLTVNETLKWLSSLPILMQVILVVTV